jgi:signal transduction histidine kinase
VDGQRVFDGVIEALGMTVGADAAWLLHFDSDGYVTTLGLWSTRELSLPVGTRQDISDELRQLRESRQPYRVVLAEMDPESTFAEEARRLGIASAVGVPVVLAGQVWALAVVARFGPELFPGDTETRMTSFIEPVTAALANAWTRARLEEWHAEQEALRRLAELAATGLPPDELLRVVVVEASALVDGRAVVLARLDEDGLHGAVVAVSDERVPVGRQFSAQGDSVAARVLRSGRPARIDDYSSTAGGLFAEELGARAVVAAPVRVESQLWGILAAVSPDEPLPVGTETRLAGLAEIAVTALSIIQTREQLQRLADEQAALLRVSQLVARGAAEKELFDAVATEAAGLMHNEATTLVRYDGDRTFTVLAACRGLAEFGTVFSLPDGDAGTLSEMLRTGRAARTDSHPQTPIRSFSSDDLVGSSVAVPIVVEDQVWGGIVILTRGRRLPTNTAGRLEKFGEMVTAAIANSQARTEVVQLADEQAALRRVAELVARGASLQEVFAEISIEASRLLAVGAALLRFDPDGYAEIVGTHDGLAQLGLRIPTTDSYIGRMFAVGQAVRLADYEEVGFAAAVRDLGLEPGTAVPITVEGKIWGALKTSPSGAVLRPGADRNLVSRVAEKLEKFAALAAAAIANAENRAQLTASRARIVATADEARQRLQRDVHDGAQQRLVQTVLTLKLARDAAAWGRPTDDLIEEALGYAERATAELRDLVHGILPASLSRGGLRSGIESLIADLAMSVEFAFAAPRLPTSSEITAYFIVAEALTNVVKHAAATQANVSIGFSAGRVTIEVRDNGTGGADPARGSGLTGLMDRVETAEGELTITSPLGEGTVLHASFPVVWS